MGSKYKVHPYFFAVNISFHVLDISRFKKKVDVGKMWGGGGWVHGLTPLFFQSSMHSP